MRAACLKYYRGTPVYKRLLEVAEVVNRHLWYSVFPNSSKLGVILIKRTRPNKTAEFCAVIKERDFIEMATKETEWLRETFEKKTLKELEE